MQDVIHAGQRIAQQPGAEVPEIVTNLYDNLSGETGTEEISNEAQKLGWNSEGRCWLCISAA
jgi:hypothetical protein